MLILTSGNYLGAFCKHEQRDAPALCDMLSDKLIRDNGWDGARSNRAAQLLAELLPAPAPALDPVTPEASQEAVPFAATETPSRSKFGFMGTPKEQDGAPPVPQQPLQPLGFDALLGDDWPLPPLLDPLPGPLPEASSDDLESLLREFPLPGSPTFSWTSSLF